MHPLVGDVAHVDLGPTQLLQGAHQGREPKSTSGVFDPDTVRAGQAHQLGRHDGQEPLAKVLGEVGGEALRVASRFRCVGYRDESPGRRRSARDSASSASTSMSSSTTPPAATWSRADRRVAG